MKAFGFQSYSVNGEVIPDIKAYARERGEEMVVIEWTRESPNSLGTKMIKETWEDEMPASWWANFGYCPSTQGHPREIRRYAP